MNIVYMFKNKSKRDYPNKYIGSKTECNIQELSGVDTIVSLKNGRPYYSSSSSKIFQEDFKGGDVMVASVLQVVGDRSQLLAAESTWMGIFDAVKSNEFYNLKDSVVDCYSQDKVINTFGQIQKEVASDNSSVSKRDKTALHYGFDNFGEMCLWIYDKREEGLRCIDISTKLGKHRHFANVFVRGFNLSVIRSEVENTSSGRVRDLYKLGATLQKIAEIMGIQYPSARILLGDFHKCMDYTCAVNNNMTVEEFGKEITRLIVDGGNFREVGAILNTSEKTISRYFFNYIRNLLKDTDI